MDFRHGLAIINTLLFVLIFSILAGVVLILVSSQARLNETYVRRVKAHYVAESGAVDAFDRLSRGLSPTTPSVEWSFDSATGNPSFWVTPTSVTNESGVGPSGTARINSSYDYSISW